MNEPKAVEPIDRGPLAPGREVTIPLASRPAAPHPHVIGSPLPMGSTRRSAIAPVTGNSNRVPPGRVLPGATAAGESSGLARAVNAIRGTLPLVQRLLPLLEGNILTAVSNLLTPRPQAPPPPPKVDLAPLEDNLVQLQTQHRDLRDQVMEQNASLKRVEDQLEMVRQATDRNTLEQQELLEDLKTFGKNVKLVIFIALGLVAIGFILNLILFLHIQRVLP